MKEKRVFDQMRAYTPGKQIEEVKKEFGLDRIVKLASNENPFGFSEKVRQTISDEVSSLEIYPDGYATELRSALAERLQVDGEQLVFGCGSDEVVTIICQTYLESGTNTIMATPTFPQYRHNALVEGAEIREVPLIDGYHDLDGMLEAVDEDTQVIWLCSPNNPTGCLINQAQFNSFMEKCPAHVLVVMDEAYVEYIETDDYPDTIQALNKYPNLITLRTFSKAYGLAGLRIGYGVASKAITKLLNITRGPFNTTSLAQKAALVSIQDETFLKEITAKNIENKQAFLQFCDEIGLSYYDSQANFVFVKLPISGDELFQYLMSKGFIVRSGEALGHPNGVRITIGDKQDMEEMQALIKAYLASSKEESLR
ncbi:histidinol-phosphate transaminase [Radiobacillus sp. PE A8.2]|uniref:histidinol-phosphate transaminase n=1 Tax=Radiobacillus sp. PE A8.2 TaxID=3380349 RepID=UPI00388E99B9